MRSATVNGAQRATRIARSATRSHKGSHFLPPFFHSQLNVILAPPSCTVTVARVCDCLKCQTLPSTLAAYSGWWPALSNMRVK